MKVTRTKSVKISFSATEIAEILRAHAQAPKTAGIFYGINDDGVLMSAEVTYTERPNNKEVKDE